MQTLLFDEHIKQAISHYSNANNDERGAIFTKNEVVEFILDLVGYTSDYPLYEYHLLEPSFGHGDFLLVAADRLLQSFKKFINKNYNVSILKDAIKGVELNCSNYSYTRKKLFDIFDNYDIQRIDAELIINNWVIQSDFLLYNHTQSYTHIIGNPPYVRQELLPKVLLNEYRARYSTIYDRADLYIPFIENSLNLLSSDGVLGFICSDRWIKNKYGAPLREKISKEFYLKYYIDMNNTDSFHSLVSSYPSIFVIKREKQRSTRVFNNNLPIDISCLKDISNVLKQEKLLDNNVLELSNIVNGNQPWIIQSSEKTSLLRKLENNFQTLEESNCKIGIGVATGADKVFIVDYNNHVIEPDRILPLIKTKDIVKGEINWSGNGIINPYNENGTLVNLSIFPKLEKYLNDNKSILMKRNCVNNCFNKWYKTIDRIYPELTKTSKLLIPDIKGNAEAIYEDGNFYPHHNFYYIVSDSWNLFALQNIFNSGIAHFFISSYAIKMRGNYLRFQAQYLRKIRIPIWESISKQILLELIKPNLYKSSTIMNEIITEIYHLTKSELAIIRDYK